MQLDPPILSCVCGLFVVVVCCITYVASYNEQKQKSKGVSQLKAGDVLSFRMPGSGVYGDPLERDPNLVRWDVLNCKVSLKSAREDYLIVFNQDLTINEEETEALRAETKIK